MIIDINMHALPENLFQDEVLLESFLPTVPQAYGEFASLIPYLKFTLSPRYEPNRQYPKNDCRKGANSSG